MPKRRKTSWRPAVITKVLSEQQVPAARKTRNEPPYSCTNLVSCPGRGHSFRTCAAQPNSGFRGFHPLLRSSPCGETLGLEFHKKSSDRINRMVRMRNPKHLASDPVHPVYPVKILLPSTAQWLVL